MPKIEYAHTRTPGVTHLLSVGEEPGDDSTSDVLLKSATVGAGIFAAAWGVPAKYATWAGLAGFGAALIYFSTRSPRL